MSSYSYSSSLVPKKKALTFVLSSLLFTATVLEGLFGEYHSSSAALGQQRPEVTKQPLVRDWSATSESSHVFHCHCFIPCTNFPSVFQAKRRLTSHIASEVADQSRTSGCLVTSVRCWPSAADGEWYSLKRPSSTVAVSSSELNTKVSAFFLSTFCSS